MISKAVDIELANYGTGITQVQILYLIERYNKPLNPSKLSRLLETRPHSMSALLIRMEKQGLLYRARSKKDQRQLKVLITDKGEAILNKIGLPAILERIFSHLPAEQVTQFSELAQSLYDVALEEVQGKAIVHDETRKVKSR